MNLPRFAATLSLLAVFAAFSPFAGAVEDLDIEQNIMKAQPKRLGLRPKNSSHYLRNTKARAIFMAEMLKI